MSRSTTSKLLQVALVLGLILAACGDNQSSSVKSATKSDTTRSAKSEKPSDTPEKHDSLSLDETNPDRTFAGELAAAATGLPAIDASTGFDTSLLVVTGTVTDAPTTFAAAVSQPVPNDPNTIAYEGNGKIHQFKVEKVLFGTATAGATIPHLVSESSGYSVKAGDRLLLILVHSYFSPVKHFLAWGAVNSVFRLDRDDKITPLVGTTGAQPNAALRTQPETLAQATLLAQTLDPALAYQPTP